MTFDRRSRHFLNKSDSSWKYPAKIFVRRSIFHRKNIYRSVITKVNSVSRSLKKGQGATPRKGNLNARQPASKGQPLDAATHVKQQKNMCQGQFS